MKINEVIPFPRRQVVEVIKSLGFSERNIKGPLQFTKENFKGRIHIIVDAQQKRETRIRIHQDFLTLAGDGKELHLTQDGDMDSVEVFNAIESILYEKKMEEYDAIHNNDLS